MCVFPATCIQVAPREPVSRTCSTQNFKISSYRQKISIPLISSGNVTRLISSASLNRLISSADIIIILEQNIEAAEFKGADQIKHRLPHTSIRCARGPRKNDPRTHQWDRESELTQNEPPISPNGKILCKFSSYRQKISFPSYRQGM